MCTANDAIDYPPTKEAEAEQEEEGGNIEFENKLRKEGDW